jgi:hypothetical protein
MRPTILGILLLLALPAVLLAEDLQLVTSVPYDELRPMMRRAPAGFNFGEHQLEVWADVGSDCFGDSDDVFDVFLDWFERWGPNGFPSAVEFRCKPWREQQSIFVISQFTSRRHPPNHLSVFSANADGSKLDRMLVDNDSVGTARVVGHYMEFTLHRGRATSVVVLTEFPEQSGGDEGYPEWLSACVYLLDEETRCHYLDVVGAYRRGEAGFRTLLLVTRDLVEPTWSLRSVASSIDVITSSRPMRINGATRAERVQAEVEALRPVLEGVADIRAAEDTIVLFENHVLKTYMLAFKESTATHDAR